MTSAVSALVAILFVIFAALFGVGPTQHYKTREANTPLQETVHRLRITATALETFSIDNNSYPESTTSTATYPFSGAPAGTPSFRYFTPVYRASSGAIYRDVNEGYPSYSLTTPVAYMMAFQKDPFSVDKSSGFAYVTDGKNYLLWSPGPDGKYDIAWEDYDLNLPNPTAEFVAKYSYDATNGAISPGDVWRNKSNGLRMEFP